jgi:hypothetical protein
MDLIRQTYSQLLEDENNSYSYISYYRTEINKLQTKNDTQELMYILKSIYMEKGACRYHSKDEIASKIEKVIVLNILPILKSGNILQQKISEMNQILLDTAILDLNLFSDFEKKHGYEMKINYEPIILITDKDLTDLWVNFNGIKLLTASKYDIKLNEVVDYLLYLYYFTIYTTNV